MLKTRLLKDRIARHYMLTATVMAIFFLFLIGGGLFLKWVLADGQKYVNETGYINLSKEIINKGVTNLK